MNNFISGVFEPKENKLLCDEWESIFQLEEAWAVRRKVESFVLRQFSRINKKLNKIIQQGMYGDVKYPVFKKKDKLVDYFDKQEWSKTFKERMVFELNQG